MTERGYFTIADLERDSYPFSSSVSGELAAPPERPVGAAGDINTEQILFDDLKRAERILHDARLGEAQAKEKRERAEKMFIARAWRYVNHTHAIAKGLQ